MKNNITFRILFVSRGFREDAVAAPGGPGALRFFTALSRPIDGLAL